MTERPGFDAVATNAVASAVKATLRQEMDLFVPLSVRYRVADVVLAALIALPIEQRMEAMGMLPVTVDRDGVPYHEGVELPMGTLDNLWTLDWEKHRG